MPLTVEQVIKQLTDSSIIEPGKLRDFIPPQAQPKDADELARELVKQKHLTKFQAQQILAGRAKALILGSYTVLDKIGAGGMGQVFKAEHRRMHRMVAIKMLPSAVVKDPAAVARFEREVMAAAKLLHPNIVAAFDADQAGGNHFLVMEYVEGIDLSATVKKHGTLPVAQAIDYIRQAACGLAYAHKHGVIHRDIKPANLLVDAEGTVKILDMGLARIDAAEGDIQRQSELTGTGAVMGTVDYMSPEQAFSTKNADARADIYSLGCTLHYLIAGKATYAGDSVVEKILAHRELPIPALADAQPSVPRELQAIFERMIAKRAEDRYPSMNELLADLERCQAAMRGESTFVSQPSITSEISDLSIALGNQSLRGIPAPEIDLKVAPKTAARPPKAEGRKQGPPWWRQPKMLAAAGAAWFFVLALGIVVVIRNKKGAEVARLDLPAGHTVEVAQEKAKASAAKPWEMAEFKIWMRGVAKLSPEEQVAAVGKKLQELNFGFDGKLSPRIANGQVQRIALETKQVSDLSPLRAFPGLIELDCPGTGGNAVADLSPLAGLPLKNLICKHSQVSDLSPLRGMPLTTLIIPNSQVSDLAPLKGMPLSALDVRSTPLADITPLVECKSLTMLSLSGTRVTAEGVTALQQALPNCKIFWDGATASTSGNVVWLDDLQAVEQKGTVGSLGRHGFDHMDNPIQWHGKQPAHALFEHPNNNGMAQVTFALHGKYERFLAVAGLAKQPDLKEGLTFRVVGDDRELWASPPVQDEQQGVQADVSVRGIGQLRLEVHCPGNAHSAHAVWIDPRLTLVAADYTTDVLLLGGQIVERWTSQLLSKSFPGVRIDNRGKQGTSITTLLANVSAGDYADAMPKVIVVQTGSGELADVRRAAAAYAKMVAALRTAFPPSALLLTSVIPPGADRIAEAEQLNSEIAMLADGQAIRFVDLDPVFIEAGKLRDDLVASGLATRPGYVRWGEVIEPQITQLVAARAVAFRARRDALDFSPKRKSYVEIPDWTYDGSSPLTVEAWVLPRSIGQRATIVGNQESAGFALEMHDDGTWAGQFYGGNKDTVSRRSTVQATPGRWQHVAMVTDGANVDLFVDGKRQSKPLPRKMPYAASQVRLLVGANPSPGQVVTEFFDGQITEVRISSMVRYDADFSPEERFHPDERTEVLYHCDEGRGTIAKDASSHNRDGKIAGATWVAPAVVGGAPDTSSWQTPQFEAWVKATQALPAQQQIDAVLKKLMELNPGFDGTTAQTKPKIENGVVTVFTFYSDEVTDLSPVRALTGLQNLYCPGSALGKGRLADLSPLVGMKLTSCNCRWTMVDDLSPLRGMPLTYLNCYSTPIRDLSPLEGMPLTILYCDAKGVVDLSPLRGMPLVELHCEGTAVSDLSPLAGMKLERLDCYKTNISDLSALKEMPLVGLAIHETPVADVSPLESCKRLAALDIENTKVTAAAVARLQKALPNCKIKSNVGRVDDSGKAMSQNEILTSPDFVWSEPENLGRRINCSGTDGGPAISGDGLTLVYVSVKAGGLGSGYDLWMADRESIDEPFGEPQNLGPGVNSAANDMNPNLSPDALTLTFASERAGKNIDLFMATRRSRNEPFGAATALTEFNSTAHDHFCALSGDGRFAIIATGREGGMGLNDLWQATRPKASVAFSDPAPLGIPVNSENDETAPWLSLDGSVLLLMRKELGTANSDLYLAVRSPRSGWFNEPTLVGPPISQPDTPETQSSVTSDGRLMFFSSMRPGGVGGYDIWQSRRVPKVAKVSSDDTQLKSVDRAAAEWALSKGGSVIVKANKTVTTVKPDQPLPAGPLQVQTMYFLDAEQRIGDDELACLEGLTALEGLNLSKLKGYTDTGLEHLAGLTTLRKLTVYFNDQLTDAGIRHLVGLKNLEELDIAATRVTEQGLRNLLGCHLRKLSIGGRNEANQMLPVVVEFQDLVELSIHGKTITDANASLLTKLPKLKHLALLGTAMTDEGLKAIAATTVQDLHLDGGAFSDAGLKHLEAMTGLAKLALRGTKVTAAAAASFQQAVPGCKVSRNGQ
ncbi:MAG TPA: protein kinase [Pirellulales bacterium]|nr:protein kinase [Pirellulales bacterium]